MNHPLSRLAPLVFAALLCLPASGFAASHTVNISGSIANAYGNSSDGGASYINADPDDNILNINSGGSVTSLAIGASISDNGALSATGNTVNVHSGGTVGGAAGANVYSVYNAATASGNFANVAAGGTVRGSVIGGSAQAGGSSGNAVANSNTVTIDGTVNAVGWSIMGGNANDYSSGSATASYNTVIINDGASVTVNLIAGGFAGSGTGSADATHNTVTIKSGNLNPSINLFGGIASGGGSDVFTGNTLNLHRQITVDGLKNFEKYNFYLPSSLSAGQAMLTVTNGDGSGTAANIANTTVNVGIEGSSSALRQGDKVILIDSTIKGLTGAPVNTTADGSGMQGVTLKYVFGISATSTQLLATVASAGVNEQTKALSEGFLGGAVLVNQGADLIAGPGLASAVKAARAGSEGSYDLAAFGTVSGGSLRYNSGSHVDMSSLSLLAGLAKGVELEAGRLTLGAFFEYGNGSYDTYNSFSNAAAVHGEGDIHHTGAAFWGAWTSAPAAPAISTLKPPPERAGSATSMPALICRPRPAAGRNMIPPPLITACIWAWAMSGN